MCNLIEHSAPVPLALALKRLDTVAAALFPDYSRARLQRWIISGELTLDGKVRPSKFKVASGALLEIRARSESREDAPEALPLDILHEDDMLLVINKPAGLVVHPGAGNRSGTLLNALLHHCPEIEGVPRAGIVHRLDKDTTGLMVVAKTLKAQTRLVEQLSARSVRRIYEAVVYGQVRAAGEVNAPIGRHPRQRIKMAVVMSGKPAVTRYAVKSLFGHHTHLELSLLTGRTHQIRVHMQELGHSLVGDPAYGGHFRKPGGAVSDELLQALKRFPRQALHARQLSFVHPGSDELANYQSPLPDDMIELLAVLGEGVSGDQG